MSNEFKIEELSTELLNENTIESEDKIIDFFFSGDEIILEKKKKFSEYKFILENENCINCNIDTFTIIKDNYTIFNNFINTDSIYTQELFNFFNKIFNL